jgi:hypothetical protein
MVETRIDLGRVRTEEEVEMEDKRKGRKAGRGVLINVISSCLFWSASTPTNERKLHTTLELLKDRQ